MPIEQNILTRPLHPRIHFETKKVAGQTVVTPSEKSLNDLVHSIQHFSNQVFDAITHGGADRGPDLVSASTITVSYPLHNVTGATSISTITAISTFSGGTVFLIAGGAWQLVSGGNIATPYIPGPGEIVMLVYDSQAKLWHVPGQPASGGGGGGVAGAPTNPIVPSSFTSRMNPDGSMTYQISWTYTQGANQATGFLVYFNETAFAPTTADTAVDVGLAQTASFSGFPSNVTVSFGVAAYRTANAQTVLGPVTSSASAPNWIGITGGTPNFTGTIQGTSSSVVVANAANGQTAFSGTVKYRSTGSPTNNITPASFTSAINTDASVNYTLGWTYTQGINQADGFLVFWKVGDTATFDVTTDSHYLIGEVASTVFFTLRGIPSDVTLSFGVSAFRRTENGLEIGTIISSAVAPDWQGVNSGTPFYTGRVSDSWNLPAAGGFVAVGLVGNINVTKDGTNVTWPAQDADYDSGSFVYGLGYDVLLYDLTNKAVLYAHCFDTFDYGATAVVDSDLFEAVTTGSGATAGTSAGKFGQAISSNAVNSSNRAYYRTKAASVTYKSLRWAELWFKRSGNPASAGDILHLDTVATAGSALLPLLRLNTNGTVTAFCWDGATGPSVTSSATVTDGTFHWIVSRVTGTNLELYIDGVSQGSTATTVTTFYTSAPGDLRIFLGTGALDLVGADCFYDELVVSTNQSLRTPTSVPTREASDTFGGATGSIFTWHFQEPLATYNYCQARRPARCFANIINGYNDVAKTIGDSLRYMWLVQGNVEPNANRLNDGLPQAISTIGGNRIIFSSGQFRTYSAYALVGQPLLGEGNGLEAYKGTADAATDSFVKISFQVSGSKIAGALTGSGEVLTNRPGVPTNNPVPSAIVITTTAVGQELVSIAWTYTQPALSGENLLADGFVVYVKTGVTATLADISATPDAIYKVSIDKLAFVLQAPLGQSLSFAVASYRKSSSGIEIGPAQSSSSAPNWLNRGGNSKVTGSTGGGGNGIGTGTVGTGDLGNSQVTTPKRQAVNTQSGTVGSISANTGSGPVTFQDVTITFNFSLAQSPVVVPRSSAFNDPCTVIELDASHVRIDYMNLATTSQNPTSTADYW